MRRQPSCERSREPAGEVIDVWVTAPTAAKLDSIVEAGMTLQRSGFVECQQRRPARVDRMSSGLVL